MKKENVLIVGLGDVGKTLSKYLKNYYSIFEKDQDDFETNEQIKVMHICYPFSEEFEKETIKYINLYKPELTIINSTVGPGTTKRIQAKINKSMIAHSPFIGDHNCLHKGLLTFVKIVGYNDIKVGRLAEKHFNNAKIKTKLIKDTNSTELGKLLLTTQYALNIAFHQEMERMTKKTNVDFKAGISEFQLIYNEGYKKLRPNIKLPELKAGFIGGTCLMPNIKILKKYFKSKFLDDIEISNKKFKQKKF